jgi:hypothetical protein
LATVDIAIFTKLNVIQKHENVRHGDFLKKAEPRQVVWLMDGDKGHGKSVKAA